MKDLSTKRLIPRRDFINAGLIGAVGLNGTEPTAAKDHDQADEKVPLKPNAARTSFDFETEQMQGTIRADGAYHGVASLVDRRTGKQLIHPNLSALNLYRLAAANQVLDALRREMARRLNLADEGLLAFAFVTDFPLLEWN